MALWLSWLFCILACLLSIEASVNVDTANYQLKFFEEKDNIHDNNSEVYKVAGFECIIPPKLDTSKDARLQRDAGLDSYEREVQKTEAIELVRRFNENYKQTKITINKGFWNYTLIFDKFLHQSHREPDVSSTLLYTLFSTINQSSTYMFDSSPFYSDRTLFELISEDHGLKFVTQKLGKGNICDLTGLERTTTMHYMCNPEAKEPILKDADEWRTCDYYAIVESDWFCPNSMLNEDLSLGKTAWSRGYSHEQTLIECSVAENFPYENYTLPFDFSQYKLYPLSLGLLLGTPYNETQTETKILILFQNYKTVNVNFYDLEDQDLQNYVSDFLYDIAGGFKKIINQGLFLRSSLKTAVEKNDTFIYTLPLYYSDGKFIGNVILDKQLEMIKIAISDEKEFDFTRGNWISFQHNE